MFGEHIIINGIRRAAIFLASVDASNNPVTLADGSPAVASKIPDGLGALQAGEDQTNDVQRVEHQNTYSYITTATTTDLSQNGGAYLHCITVLNATLTGTVTIYDETTGDTTTTVGVIPAGAVGGTYIIDAIMTKGLQVVTSNAADDIIVSYRPSYLD